MNKTKIYTLKDPRDNRIRYIGKTNRSLNDRLKYHVWQLNNNRKSNWIKTLLKLNLMPTIELLDEVPEEEWQYWERFWIFISRYLFPDLLNVLDGGNDIPTFERSKEQLDIIKTKLQKKIKCFNTNGDLLYIFSSIKEASDFLNCKNGHISSCAKGKLHTVNNFVFRYHQDSFNKYPIKNKKEKIILQYDLNMNLISEWSSIITAAKELNLLPQSISRVLRGERKKYKGFIWKYRN